MPSAKWMRKKLRETIPVGQAPTCKCYEQWKSYFLQGTDRDRWGQKENAVQFYQLLIEDLRSVSRTGQSSTLDIIDLGDIQKSTISKMIHCLNCRIDIIQNPSEKEWMTLDQLMRLKPVMKNFGIWKGVFPVLLIDEPCTSTISLVSRDSGLSELYESEENLNNINSAEDVMSLRLPKKHGLTRFSIHIQKFGLRKNVVDPYLVISLRDRDSVNLADIQSTDCADRIHDFHAEFDDCHYEIQRYVEKIPKGSAIFFELRSSQDKKTKYYAILARELFTTGKGFLELYKGPVDYHRKKLNRATNKKPLFLHVQMKMLDC